MEAPTSAAALAPPPPVPTPYTLPRPPIVATDAPVCIVTGSSRGIGRAVALALGAAGARVRVGVVDGRRRWGGAGRARPPRPAAARPAPARANPANARTHPPTRPTPQVVVNYASSAGAADDVAAAIKASGGDAIVVGADLSKAEDIQR